MFYSDSISLLTYMRACLSLLLYAAFCNRRIADLTVPVYWLGYFSYDLILMAVILASEIKSEPLDQSDGSDYTRNCEP